MTSEFDGRVFSSSPELMKSSLLIMVLRLLVDLVVVALQGGVLIWIWCRKLEIGEHR